MLLSTLAWIDDGGLMPLTEQPSVEEERYR